MYTWVVSNQCTR